MKHDRLFLPLLGLTFCIIAGLPVPGVLAAPLSLQAAPSSNTSSQGQTEMTAPNSSGNEATDSGSSQVPLKLQIQTQGFSESIILRQRQLQRHLKYQEKTKPLKSALRSVQAYLNSLGGEAPSLQRLSAYSAETWLNWTQLEKSATDEERAYQSYRLMKEAAMELQALSRYWITSERVKQLLGETLRQEQVRRNVMQGKREKIEKALKALEQMDQLQEELGAEFPR